MIGKTNHVKNPLTVIAIFACIAEVSGAGVLPFIDASVQHIYVWFLMLFPAGLVLLFFWTLWFHHSVLYAPSDYEDQQMFADLLVTGTFKARIDKLGEEVADDSANESESAQADAGDGEPVSPAGEGEECNQDNPDASTGEQPGTLESDLLLPAGMRLHGQKVTSAFYAEELAIDKLAKYYRVPFERNVSLRGNPKIIYDAVYGSNEGFVVVEVKYSAAGIFAVDNIKSAFDRVDKLWRELPAAAQSKFEFCYVIVFGKNKIDPDRIMKYKLAVLSTANQYPFRSKAITYKLADLEPPPNKEPGA